MRYSRYEHSKSINPDFHFQVPRYMTAYGETTFPLAYWQDGRELKKGKPLTCRSMRIFYEQMKMPKDFWRRDGKFGLFDVGPVVNEMRSTHQLEAGHNEGVGNWVKASDADQALLDANGVRLFSLFPTRLIRSASGTDLCFCSRARSTSTPATRLPRSCTRMPPVFSARRSRITSYTCGPR